MMYDVVRWVGRQSASPIQNNKWEHAVVAAECRGRRRTGDAEDAAAGHVLLEGAVVVRHVEPPVAAQARDLI
jgi:hypothetical protein